MSVCHYTNYSNINYEHSFNCIPRYFVAEGFLSFDYSGIDCQVGIALKKFLNINTNSIVSIERKKQSLIIKSYYNENLTIFQIKKLLKKYVNNFDKYPTDGTYKETLYNFKLLLTENNII